MHSEIKINKYMQYITILENIFIKMYKGVFIKVLEIEQ